MIAFKINVLSELKAAGYNTNRLRKEKVLSENTIQAIRKGSCPSTKALDTICRILETQPGLIIKWVPDEKDE